jgi:hypothetical protein
LESIYCYGLPVTPAEHAVGGPPLDIGLLPTSREITEDIYFEALDQFWFDRNAYRRAWEFQQDTFVDNRDAGLQRQWKLLLELLEISED